MRILVHHRIASRDGQAVKTTSPLRLFEYLQLGRAIVAPDTANIRDVVIHQHDALLFDPVRNGALETTLLRLCTDAALRTRLGNFARQSITEKSLTWSRNAERILAIAKATVLRAPGTSPDHDTRWGRRSAP